MYLNTCLIVFLKLISGNSIKSNALSRFQAYRKSESMYTSSVTNALYSCPVSLSKKPISTKFSLYSL